MSHDESLQILLPFDQWATAQLISACRPLSAEQFHAQFNIGPGSLHSVISHTLAVMRTWTETLAGAQLGARIDSDGINRTADQLLGLHNQFSIAFQNEAGRQPLTDIATRKLRSGDVIQLTRCEIITHVITHGMHHRAQALNMLRQLGVQSQPPSSVVQWRM